MLKRNRLKFPSSVKATTTVLVALASICTTFKSVRSEQLTDSLIKLIESRPQHLALIRCSPPGNNGISDIANWPVCGIVGDVPQREQRIAINRKSFSDRLSVDFVDDDGMNRKSQDWELVSLKVDKKGPSIASADIVQVLSEWQDANKWIRGIELQKLSTDSPILHRINKAVRGQVGQIGKSPWNSSKAYVDRRVLKLQHGVPLFKANGELVELAALETGRSPYTPFHYPVPKSLSEYSNVDTGFVYSEARCEGASRQALLVHEPHQRGNDETALFFLLAYLQEQYPGTFGKLHIFQEGQPNNLKSSKSVFKLPRRGLDDQIINMLRDSRNTWKSSFYAPLNGKPNPLEEAIQSFLVGKGLPTEGIWDEAVDFYSFREKSGALDTRAAFEDNLRDRTNQQKLVQDYSNRLKNLEPRDANFAATLIERNRFRGALAYELYIEGNTSVNSSNLVSVHGLDDAGLYFASCALLYGCMGTVRNSSAYYFYYAYYDSWKAIQPFRDWVMARTVVKKLKSLDKSVVPVVAASVGTHLPLVREFLCDAGIGTVTLAPSKNLTWSINSGLSQLKKSSDVSLNYIKPWKAPPNWHDGTTRTTPISSSLVTILNSLPQSGALVLPPAQGISQILETWLINPGLL